MAKATKPVIDPAKNYRVVLNRVVRIGKAQTTQLSPRHEITMAGRVLSSLPPDAVTKYEEM